MVRWRKQYEFEFDVEVFIFLRLKQNVHDALYWNFLNRELFICLRSISCFIDVRIERFAFKVHSIVCFLQHVRVLTYPDMFRNLFALFKHNQMANEMRDVVMKMVFEYSINLYDNNI